MSFRRIVASNFNATLRAATRPPLVRQVPRRNFMVGLQPGIEEQALTKEAGTYNPTFFFFDSAYCFCSAVEMIAGYFGMMVAACAVGSIAGAYFAEHDVIF